MPQIKFVPEPKPAEDAWRIDHPDVLAQWDHKSHQRYEVASAKGGDAFHTVFVTGEVVVCTCEGAKWRARCRHIDIIRSCQEKS